MENKEIRKQLENMADENYRQFIIKLTPTADPDSILGIRIPQLRKFSQQLVKDDWRLYLDTISDNSFEEIMLQGICIGQVKADLNEIIPYVKSFIPKIDNWAVCDIFCSGLKIARKYPLEMWEFITPYLCDSHAYYIRFGVVMIIGYYIKEEYLTQIFNYFDKIKCDDYYVKMSVAWAISACYVKYPDITMQYLNENDLDDFTYNKSLQKIIESLKTDNETKQIIKSMKRIKRWKNEH